MAKVWLVCVPQDWQALMEESEAVDYINKCSEPQASWLEIYPEDALIQEQ